MSGAALADEAVYADGASPTLWPWWVVFLAVLASMNWAAQSAWRAIMKTPPPFGFYSVYAIVIALLLGAVGVFVVPAFAQLFESFGADLPTPTGLLMHYRALLAILVVPLLALLYRLRASPRCEAYFAAILACEMCLLVLSVVALYLPVFSMSEAV